MQVAQELHSILNLTNEESMALRCLYWMSQNCNESSQNGNTYYVASQSELEIKKKKNT